MVILSEADAGLCSRQDVRIAPECSFGWHLHSCSVGLNHLFSKHVIRLQEWCETVNPQIAWTLLYLG